MDSSLKCSIIQELPNKHQIPKVSGEEQGSDLSLELLVLDANLVRRLVLRHNLYLLRLQTHCSDKVLNFQMGFLKSEMGFA
ncbi:hypothetical protein COP2_028466 [Malus domestica]